MNRLPILFMKQFSLLVFVLWFLCAQPVEAHSPYVIKIKTLEVNRTNSLILERLFGDGVVVSDPVRLQVRNNKGVVIAYSATASHVAEFCPLVQFCWAFPYEDSIVTPMYLDFKKLNYNETSESDPPEQLSIYPSDDNKPKNFLKGSTVIQLLSPVIIIGDRIFTYIFLCIAYFIPAFLLATLRTVIASQKGFTSFWLTLLGFIILFSYYGFVISGTILCVFSYSMSLVYSLFFIALSTWAGFMNSKKFITNRILIKPIEE